MKEYVEEKTRLFDTDLRRMTRRDCYRAVATDGTYTKLLIREFKVGIKNDSLLSELDPYKGGGDTNLAYNDRMGISMITFCGIYFILDFYARCII